MKSKSKRVEQQEIAKSVFRNATTSEKWKLYELFRLRDVSVGPARAKLDEEINNLLKGIMTRALRPHAEAMAAEMIAAKTN